MYMWIVIIKSKEIIRCGHMLDPHNNLHVGGESKEKQSMLLLIQYFLYIFIVLLIEKKQYALITCDFKLQL